MAIGANTAWEVRPTNGNDTNCSGGFCLSGPTYATDGSVTSATTNAPVFSSASYSFVAGDVGAYLYIKAGTSAYIQLYQILSVASNNATLSTPIGSAATLSSLTWGLDRSQQNAAAFSGTDLVSVSSLVVSSVSHSFTVADIGNTLNISAGSGFTASIYQINSVSAGQATLDRSPGTVGTGGTWALGGALQTIGKAVGAGVGSNKIFVKAEGSAPHITTTASIAINITGVTPTATVMPSRIIGYTTTRGDNGQVTIKASTNTGINIFNVSTSGWVVENFVFDCNSLGTSRVLTSGSDLVFRNCSFKNFTTSGLYVNGGNDVLVADCEFSGGTSAATNGALAFSSVGRSRVMRNYIHDNACPGLQMSGAGSEIMYSLLANNTGASSDGIQAGQSAVVMNNTIYKSGRHGINFSASSNFFCASIRNNILSQNSGYGANGPAAGIPASSTYDGNAYYLNTSGARNNMDDGAAQTTPTNFINLSAPYVNTLDVILTADPFTNATGGDFTLNNTTGGGKLCRGAGTPGALPGISQVGHFDMGCLQHADAASGLFVSVGMQGGFPA